MGVQRQATFGLPPIIVSAQLVALVHWPLPPALHSHCMNMHTARGLHGCHVLLAHGWGCGPQIPPVTSPAGRLHGSAAANAATAAKGIQHLIQPNHREAMATPPGNRPCEVSKGGRAAKAQRLTVAADTMGPRVACRRAAVSSCVSSSLIVRMLPTAPESHPAS